ncbi:MAG: mannonate dehydratase [Alphaproteobacteria bacterium]
MKQSWRWFGKDDPVTLQKIKQAGATDVVYALYHIPVGKVWPYEEIKAMKDEIEAQGLVWSVVESLAVHQDIRLKTGNYKQYLENYKQSLKNLAKADIRIICYNFMPVLDWTRTELKWEDSDGSKALRFDNDIWAAFDIFILERKNAKADYDAATIKRAEKHAKQMSDADKAHLLQTVAAGLPGANEEGHDLNSLRLALSAYDNISADELRDNLSDFINEIIPLCEQENMLMAMHPDDPPRSILGLPRIFSTADDVRKLFAMNKSKSNGLTLCAGSFGVRADNDLTQMAYEFADRIHFVHLRSTLRDKDNQNSFIEANHLAGDVDMFSLCKALTEVEKQRRDDGESTLEIPFRPDHGRLLDGDDEKNPGYSWIGRLKGLAELRGLLYAINRVYP